VVKSRYRTLERNNSQVPISPEPRAFGDCASIPLSWQASSSNNRVARNFAHGHDWVFFQRSAQGFFGNPAERRCDFAQGRGKDHLIGSAIYTIRNRKLFARRFSRRRPGTLIRIFFPAAAIEQASEYRDRRKHRCKNCAAWCGAEKPTVLPGRDHRSLRQRFRPANAQHWRWTLR